MSEPKVAESEAEYAAATEVDTTAMEGRAEEVGSEPATSREVVRRADRTPLSQRDPVSLAKHFAASGYFADAREMSQAVVKIVAGEELGFGPMTAMAGIHIIEGKPSFSSNLIATCVKRPTLPLGGANPYSYRVVEIDDEGAEIRFLENGEEIGRSKFTIGMAKRAGLVKDKSGWVKFPEAMLFARALTQGVRWFCPDVTAGSPAYTPEELGADVNEHGEVVALPTPEPQAEPGPVGPLNERVDEMEKGIEATGITHKALDLLLGSIGVDALRAHSAKARRERLESLAPEQADALSDELDGLADTEDGDDG